MEEGSGGVCCGRVLCPLAIPIAPPLEIPCNHLHEVRGSQGVWSMHVHVCVSVHVRMC